MSLRTLSLFAVGALAGCGNAAPESPTTRASSAGSEPSPAPLASASTSANEAVASPVPSVDDSLARLRQLDVIQVGDLIVGLPAEAYNCYGNLCADWTQTYVAAEPAVAPRLAAFVDVAQSAATAAGACSCSERVDQNLAQLRALSIFRTVDIIQTVPQNNPNCYGNVCPEDVAAANAANAERAAKLDAITNATRGL